MYDPSPLRAQWSPTYCAWSSHSVPVYFKPGTLAANGFNVTNFREAFADALAVWNEESGANVDLYYAGETTASVPTPGRIIVSHGDDGSCADPLLAVTSLPGSGDCSGGGVFIQMILKDPCTHAVRPWVTTWPGSTAGGGFIYEGSLIHELGHALGLPDVTTQHGVMHGWALEAGAGLHLYTDDGLTVQQQMGLTTRNPATISSTNATSFGAPSLLASYFSSQGPTVTAASDGVSPFRIGVWDQIWQLAGASSGNHGSWTGMTSPPNGYIGSIHDPVSISRSNSDNEVILAWPSDCHTETHCDIRWALTSNGGSSWSTGTISGAGAIGRVEVAYDAFRNRFVLAYINGDSARIYTASAIAQNPLSWSVPQVASQTVGGFAQAFRYMGGVVFDSSGLGLLTAGAFDTTGRPGVIVQMAVTYPLATRYSVGAWSYANSTLPLNYVTRRPFGLARSSGGTIALAWRGGSSTRAFTTAIKASMSPTSAFGAGGERASSVINSVDIAWSPVSNTFLGAFSWP
ncbi:MAG: hypothetical protein IPK60_18620 [Sandaracinaceae bacterium]|nr:hypothetical protein [Sandaracinaceae bacterium]